MPAQKSKKEQRLVAIEVDSLETWEVICALQPHYKELDADVNVGNFVVVSPDDLELEGAILAPNAITTYFDHIEPNDRKVKLVTLVR